MHSRDNFDDACVDGMQGPWLGVDRTQRGSSAWRLVVLCTGVACLLFLCSYFLLVFCRRRRRRREYMERRCIFCLDIPFGWVSKSQETKRNLKCAFSETQKLDTELWSVFDDECAMGLLQHDMLIDLPFFPSHFCFPLFFL
mgnify:CR=1 FL=1